MLGLEESRWPRGFRYKTHIAVLTAFSLAIGLYLASTMVLIAKDGTLYIEIAQKMAGGILDAVRKTNEHPGYPFLIYGMHQLMGIFYGADSLGGWIISAQAVSLLSKLIATIALYFAGGYFVGSRFSFWGVLILSLLPDAVEFGSDALSDWPSLMFLSVGFLLLLFSAEHRKSWMWGLAGVMAGLGYLIRPECGQIVFYGGVWLAYNVIRPQPEMRRGLASGSLFLLAAGFAVLALPYMQCKGYILPEQRMWKLPAILGASEARVDSVLCTTHCLAVVSIGKLTRYVVIINNMCETLIYYFIPFLVIGSYYYFRRVPRTSAQTFFVSVFILVNIAKVFWQLSNFDVLSRRHTLPLVAFTIFFIPVGFQMIGNWLSRQNIWPKHSEQVNSRRWFLILISVGLIICGIKLVRMAPLRWEKQGYHDAAIWLNQSTEPNATIAVPDRRIAFYAERRGVEYDSEIPKQYAYIVAVIGRKGNGLVFDREVKEVYSTELNRKKKNEKVVIYQAASLMVISTPFLTR